MAASLQETLAEAHREAQGDLSDALAAIIVAAWRSGIPQAIPGDEAASEWIRLVAPIILGFRERSALLAQGFYEQRRIAAGIEEPLSFTEPDDVPIEAVETSLKVTGIIGLTEKIVAGLALDLAFEQAGDAAAGAGIRHAQDGGRTSVANTVARDARAIGFYRQTREDPCWFCAMLASRINYKRESFNDSDARFSGDGNAKVHDNCHCTLEPVYLGTPLPDANAGFHDLWERTRRGPGFESLTPDQQRLSFRQAYEGRVRK